MQVGVSRRMHALPLMYDISVANTPAQTRSSRVVGGGRDCVGEVLRAHSIMNRVHQNHSNISNNFNSHNKIRIMPFCVKYCS